MKMKKMSRPRIACWIAIVLAAAPAGAAEVTWLHLDPGCSAKPEEIVTAGGAPAQVVACGGAGSFVFGPPRLGYQGSCGRIPGVTETPTAVPADITPPLPPSFPCSLGRCLGHTPGKPWVAVVDWRNDHGWSVAATVREASDRRVGVELYDLETPSAITQSLPSTSDLHVLLQLCALAEHVQSQPSDRPLVVNLSFGRRTSGPAGSGLGDAVSQVLSHLSSKGLFLVAAAGNHHEMLFPATSPDVISAGALDLSYYQQNGQVQPSTQTPANTAALTLGYGLYLSTEDANLLWAAPPGSSYAAALFSGWLAGYRAGGGQLPAPALKQGARWSPVPLTFPASPGGSVALAFNGTPLSGSNLAGPGLLFDRALHGAGTPLAPGPGITLQETMLAPPLSPDPLLYADAGNDPQPGVCPCVPCGPGGGGGLGPQATAKGSGTVVLDLSSSQPLPSNMELIRVFLRVGKTVYAFDRSGYQEVLAPIAAGSAGSLVLTGLDGLLPAGQQPSLVLEIYVDGLGSYWHEVPIHLPTP
jgi:hypothetical protein